MLVLCLKQQRVWSMRHEMVFGCALSIIDYSMCIAIIYAGCLR